MELVKLGQSRMEACSFHILSLRVSIRVSVHDVLISLPVNVTCEPTFKKSTQGISKILKDCSAVIFLYC
jgi:hypothetical protein